MGIKDRFLKIFRGAGIAGRGSAPRTGRLTVAKTAQSQRYSFGGLTPSRIARVLRSARDGSFDEYFELLDEVYDKDLRIGSELDKRYMDVAGLDWKVESASDDDRDIRVAEFVTANLDSIPRLKSTFMEMQEAIYKGVSLTEIVWRHYQRDAGLNDINAGGSTPGGASRSELWIDELRPWPLAAFHISDIDDIQFSQNRAQSTEHSALPVNKFIVHSSTRQGSIRRGGLGRSLLWYFMFKHYSIKDWVSFLEIYGTPLRVGRYEPGTPEDEKRVLLDAVINVATDQGVVISKQCEIEFIESNRQGSSDAHEMFQRFLNEEISIRVNGQVLTTQGSSEGKGSQALGTVHEDTKDRIVAFDAEALSDCVNSSLVVPLVEYNFGPQERYPVFRLITDKPPDTMARANLLDAAVNRVGLKVPEKYAYEELGIPMPEKGETTLSPRPPQAAPGFPGLGFSAGARNPESVTLSAREELPEDAKKLEQGVAERLNAFYAKRRQELLAAARAGKLPTELKRDNDLVETIKNLLLAAHLAGRASEKKGTADERG